MQEDKRANSENNVKITQGAERKRVTQPATSAQKVWIFLTAFILGVGALLVAYLARQPLGVSDEALQVEKTLLARLAEIGVEQSQVISTSKKTLGENVKWPFTITVVMLRPDQSLDHIRDSFLHSLSKGQLKVYEQEPGQAGGAARVARMVATYRKLPVHLLIFKEPQRVPEPDLMPITVIAPKVAIIVDDIGYNLDDIEEIFALGKPFTLSILPLLPYSTHIAERAHALDYEVMMHLPMEAEDNSRVSPGNLVTHMSPEEVQRVLERDLASIPYARGFNNHMGSKMTKYSNEMGKVMALASSLGLYFIDSRTTSETIAFSVAQDFGVLSAENDAFLDNEADVDYIKGRLAYLMEIAKNNGSAVGVCHLRPATLQALKEMLPVFDHEGIELVFASELVG